jgi:hypothetical protein
MAVTTIIDPNIDDDARGQWVTTASTRRRINYEGDAEIGKPYSWIMPDDVSSI